MSMAATKYLETSQKLTKSALMLMMMIMLSYVLMMMVMISYWQVLPVWHQCIVLAAEHCSNLKQKEGE